MVADPFCCSKKRGERFDQKIKQRQPTMITIIGMITLLVIGFVVGYYLNSEQTGTSQEFPETRSWLMENRNSSYK